MRSGRPSTISSSRRKGKSREESQNTKYKIRNTKQIQSKRKKAPNRDFRVLFISHLDFVYIADRTDFGFRISDIRCFAPPGPFQFRPSSGRRVAAASPIERGRSGRDAWRRGRNRFRRRAASRLLGRDRVVSRSNGRGTTDHSGPRDSGPAAASRREPGGTPVLRFQRNHGPRLRCSAPCPGRQADSVGRRPADQTPRLRSPDQVPFRAPRRRPGRSNLP